MLGIEVYGVPAPQGSKRHVGGGRMVEASKLVKPWREAVVAAAREAIERTGWEITAKAVKVEVMFYVPRPKGAPKTIRVYPAKVPDLDKLVRSTMDGLTNAGVWRDDAQVIDLDTGKRYAVGPDLPKIYDPFVDRPEAGASIIVSVIE